MDLNRNNGALICAADGDVVKPSDAYERRLPVVHSTAVKSYNGVRVHAHLLIHVQFHTCTSINVRRHCVSGLDSCDTSH